MKFITINPTWNVPPSIINNEYLPALQQDPTVMDRMGLKVGRNPDGTVHIWQPPGDNNALGRIRFNFPNKFLVYQHDTPDKYMFAYAKRAFSHGCMRVHDPPKYAEVLLSLVRPGDGYTEERIKKMYGPDEINIDFPTFLPVHLTYQTAFVDDAGKLEFREDIYGRDKALLAWLNGGERKVADIPIERKVESHAPGGPGHARSAVGGAVDLLAATDRISSRGCLGGLPPAAARTAQPGPPGGPWPSGGTRGAAAPDGQKLRLTAVNHFSSIAPLGGGAACRSGDLRPHFATLGR